jgi:hypothetical protein
MSAPELTVTERDALALLARDGRYTLTFDEAARIHAALDGLVRRDLADYDVHGAYLTPAGRAALTEVSR